MTGEQHGGVITGRFQGAAGSGAVTLRIDGDALSGEFDLAGQSGTITARRTSDDAATFFRPPEQRLNLTTVAWTADLDQLVEILTHEHASPFHRIPREAFEREVARVRRAIPDLDGVGVALEFRKLGALIGDGHTSVALPLGRPRFPIEFYWFEDGLRVIAIEPTHRDLLGARLVAVDEVPLDELAQRLHAFVAQGETVVSNRAAAPHLLNNPDVLRAADMDPGPSLAFTFETTRGTQRHVELVAGAERDDLAILGDAPPLWQRNPIESFQRLRLADGSVYVNWRTYDGLAGNCAALFDDLDAVHPRRLIIDLRDNGGGDFNIGRTFIEQIRTRPWLNRRGVLYVLTGRDTFSAAMTNAVDFKRTTEATLVGEPPGAAPNNWQELRRFYLANSGLRVGVSTRYYELWPGHSELSPDHSIPPAPADWGAQQDAAVRFVLAQPVP